MSRKFLDDIGYVDELAKLEHDPAYKGRFAEQQKVYGFDDRDTWNLFTTMTALLYERLKMYGMVTIVDMDFPATEHRGKMLTMQEALDLMVDLAEEVLTCDSREYVERLHTDEDAFYESLEEPDGRLAGFEGVSPWEWTKETYWFFRRFQAVEEDAYLAEKELWELWAKTHEFFSW